MGDMVLGPMAIPMIKDMETVVTGIVAIIVRGVATVIGDEIRKRRESLSLIEAFPPAVETYPTRLSHPDRSIGISPPS